MIRAVGNPVFAVGLKLQLVFCLIKYAYCKTILQINIIFVNYYVKYITLRILYFM